ncbi:hypothetical protein KJ644_02830 [Candidatus Dependentiae bacterium]|nr:hypothetical protein [Candidatus Dependentiae bacterium]MBU4387383.1 hypothetical protein [Candidatus Dependentiae bacterium]MCG2755891.1 hypothetical protein [Candidatus Dependentiae bacterium]
MCCESESHCEKGQLERHNTIIDEIVCHLPIAIFSVAMSMVVLSFLYYVNPAENKLGAYRLFHNFHYLHLLFAATGTVLTFRRYSKNKMLAIIIGFLAPAFFCTLSDMILPYFSGRLLGVDMSFHWCFVKKLSRVLPFVFAGMLNGWLMADHDSNKHLFYSQGFHFLHIFVSAMASILYLVSFGFSNWYNQIGFVFILLIFVVLAPCTLSDIVVPMIFARRDKNTKK